MNQIRALKKPFCAFLLISLTNVSCDVFFPPESEAPTPKLVVKVQRCNTYNTCLVIFEDGSNGLMTKPEEGIYGCRSLTERSYNKCAGPN